MKPPPSVDPPASARPSREGAVGTEALEEQGLSPGAQCEGRDADGIPVWTSPPGSLPLPVLGHWLSSAAPGPH